MVGMLERASMGIMADEELLRCPQAGRHTRLGETGEVGTGAKPRALSWSEARSWAIDQGAVVVETKSPGTHSGCP